MNIKIIPKRGLAFLLSLALLFGMVVPASAESVWAADTLSVSLSTIKNVYTLEETAEISVQTVQGATVYYTTNGSTPNSSGDGAQTVSEGKISVAAPDIGTNPDGGIITVKAIAVMGNAISAVEELEISFYRNSENVGSDVVLVDTQYGKFYFSSVNAAFSVGDDKNLAGDMSLTLLKDTVEDYNISSSTGTFFSKANKVTLDMKGRNLTLTCKRNGETTKVCSLKFACVTVEIIDSAAIGKATEDTLSSGTLIINNGYIASSPISKIDSVQLKSVGSNVKQAVVTSNIKTEVTNAIIERDNDTVSATSGNGALSIQKDDSTVKNSVLRSNGGPGLTADGDITITNCVIEAATYAIYCNNSNKSLTIDKGSYTGQAGSMGFHTNGYAALKDGVFTGRLYVQEKYAATSKFTIENGFFSLDPETEYVETYKNNNTISAPHSIRIAGSDRQNEPDYAGYTKYTLRDAMKAKVTFSAPASGIATLNQETGDDLVVYKGEEMDYTVTFNEDGFKVTSIKYNGQSIDLNSNPAYTVGENGTATYKLTISESFTLEIAVEAVGTSKPIVTLTTAGQSDSKQYTSLSAALEKLQSGDTLSLLHDVTYRSAITFSLENITLDLAGHTLTVYDNDAGYGIIVAAGKLTVKDSSAEHTGIISFGSKSMGIRLTGSGTDFELNGGILQDIYMEQSFVLFADNTADNATVTISGGCAKGTVFIGQKSNANIFGGEIHADGKNVIALNFSSTSGNLKMTGGTIISDKVLPGGDGTVMLQGRGAVEITGGTIIADNGRPAIYCPKGLSGGTYTVGGTASVISKGSSAIFISGTSAQNNNLSLSVSDNAKLAGATYAIEVYEGGNYRNLPVINISGGYFACGDDYIPVGDTFSVKYPDGMVMNTATVETGEYADYYTLATKDSLGGTNEQTGQQYTYQDYAGNNPGSGLGSGLDEILAAAKQYIDIGNGDNKYPITDLWEPFVETYDAAKRVRYIEGDATTNPNANQMEIDYRAKQLTLAIQRLEGYTDIDPTKLADGTYSIRVSAYKYNMSGASMASGAFDQDALLIVKNGKASLQINMHPMYALSIWGRVLHLWTYEGTKPDEARKNWNEFDIKYSGTADDKRIEAKPSNWYAHTGEAKNTADVTYAKDQGLEDKQTDIYKYPGSVTIDLLYLGVTTEESTLFCRVDVDAMAFGVTAEGAGHANLLLVLAWSTLEAVDVHPTLTVTPDKLTMLPGSKQTVTATLKGNVSAGYRISKWKSSDTSVATVNNRGEITAVHAGSCTVTVTATKDGAKDLVKTVSVTVMPEGSTPVDVRNVKSSGSSEIAELSGNVLLTGGSDRVTENGDTVTFDAGSVGRDITSSKVVIDAETAKALKGKTAVIRTNTGTITLDGTLLKKIAAAGKKVTLTISKTDTPDSSLGRFAAAYALSLTDANGKAVDFGNGRATVAVPVSENVSWAYCIANGKRTDRVPVAANNGTATFTVSHFSVWALSGKEYEAGGESGSKFFLEDGNYYVDVYLWKENGNEASMGDIAFRNNRKALVTVKDGKITRVQIATNPVFIDPYYSAIISFRLADGTEVTTLATGEITTSPAGNHYEYIKLVSFDLPESAQPDIRDAVTYIPVIFYVPDTPMDAAVGEELIARLRFEWSTAEKVEYEELTPDDDTASDTEGVVLRDEKTGIELETNTGILDKRATLSVEVLTKGSDYDFALRALSDVDAKWTIYNITTLLNGLTVDPTGAVTLRIPCNNADGFIVYLINADGSKTKLNGSIQDGYFVIRARSLGLIAVGTANGGNGGNGIVNDGSAQSPQTGDNSYLAVWSLLMLAYGGALLVLILEKKRKKITGE